MKKTITVIVILLLVAAGIFVAWKFFIQNKPVPSAPVLPEPPVAKTPEVKEKNYSQFPGILPAEELANKKAIVQLVTKGYFEVELYPDTPMATSNFINLAKDKFYEKKVFYKVIPGVRTDGGSQFVDGKDGVIYQFDDELGTRPLEKGSVAMVNIGPNTNGSRFFIVTGDGKGIDPKYTVFGKVISGQDLIPMIQEGDMIESIKILPIN
jgi:cyclophilin family peptidyl-prolyl cis-trans isomerase